ncbi:MAG: terpene cyclase/mutase family protein [Planctomycetes bacterium]|nr:terpene cyclase/mutase family protein [Planctomycetota bacterium]
MASLRKLLLVTTASFGLCLSLAAQPPARAPLPTLPVPTLPVSTLSLPGHDAQMLVTGRYLFVLRGDVVYQLDVDSLEVLRVRRLPAPDPVRPARLDDVTEGAESVERAVPAEPDAGRGGAGGRYGSRGEGRARLGRRGAPVADAVSNALEWLARHQDDDGKWDSDGFMKHDAAGEACTGPGNPTHDIGVTGLALLAFLADGSTLRSGPYSEVIKKGVQWLREQQDEKTGLFGSNAANEFIYDHAIATLAMVEAYGLSDYRLLRSTAQKGINYLEWHRNPYAMWRYQPRDGDNDTSVTSWCIQAYAAAASFRLDVNQQVMPLAMSWIDQMTDPATGRTGYSERGGVSSRFAGDHAVRYPSDRNEAMTAAALYMRFLCGQSPDANPVMRQQADLIIAKPPAWDVEGGRIDSMAWLYGSLALYQYGGRHWQEWARSLSSALLPNQHTEGAAAGSWDPIDVWGDYGGRVFTTAMHTLSLQTYYRFTRLVR